MSVNETIKLDKADGVARITFDRPKHNVFNIDMIHEFNATLEGLLHDDSLKCVVICGEGRSWSAGVEVGDHKPDVVDQMIEAFSRSFELIHGFEVPFIAAVQGACLGGGMEYAIACDVVVASEKASFGQPEIKLGFFPPYAAVRLPELVGPARAVEICTTGKIYSAAEAHAMGMVGYVTEPEKLAEKVDSLVKEIKACSPLIIRLNKRAVQAHLGLPLSDALAGVNELFLNTLMKTEDTLEGIASFTEKRRPVWKNN
jgi:cyclohexa-1,5-dienecarbonyl-CoA hydratase